MEKFIYTQSQKNIPIPPKEQYQKQLLGKTEQFLQRIRWKTYFYLNPVENPTFKETYEFKTAKTAPQSKELSKFEEDLANLVSSGLQFSNFRSNFQRKLSQDVKNVKNNECVLVNADKTSSIYQVSKDQYDAFCQGAKRP